MLRDGRRIESPGWRALEVRQPTRRVLPSPIETVYAAEPAGAKPPAPLTVTLELARLDAMGRRPYVAVWVEDRDRFPVRTIALWYDGRARWLPDLRAWYRGDRLRAMAEGTQIVDAVTTATRPSGKYTLQWDGKDNAGTPVRKGQYTVCIEAAREHGTYQIIRQAIEVGGPPSTWTCRVGSRSPRHRLTSTRAAAAEMDSLASSRGVGGPHRHPWRRRVAKVTRWLHIYGSMGSLAIVLFFSITGITLNHQEWFSGQGSTVQRQGALPSATVQGTAADAVDRLSVVEHLRTAEGLQGALAEFRVDELQCDVVFKGPAYAATVVIDRNSGRLDITESRMGVAALGERPSQGPRLGRRVEDAHRRQRGAPRLHLGDRARAALFRPQVQAGRCRSPRSGDTGRYLVYAIWVP